MEVNTLSETFISHRKPDTEAAIIHFVCNELCLLKIEEYNGSNRITGYRETTKLSII